MHLFLKLFIPIFVAIDPIGLIPIFLTVTVGVTQPQRRRIIFEAVLAATLITIAFMFLGHAIFGFLGITESDFRIAGGILLLVLAVLDLVKPGKPAVNEPEIIGIVPLALPLIAGPALLTTVLVLSEEHGNALTMLGLLANFALLLVVMLLASRLARLLGTNALRGFSKLVMVFLAAIAVNFIRVGITTFMPH